MILETFTHNLFSITKNKIISLAKTELESSEKKERLDDFVLEQIERLMDILPINFLCKWAIKKYLLPILPTITQSIFEILKIKIEEL